MGIKNKLLSTCIVAVALLNTTGVYADNKDDLLNKINSLETSLSVLKTSSTNDLETAVSDLSKKYDDVYSSLGYSTSEVNYLVSLGKLSTNYKADLITEYTELKSLISSKTTDELDDLTSIEDNIKFNYSTVSDNQKTTLLGSITDIENNYTGLQTSFSEKVSSLKSEYTTNLANYKTTVKSAFDANKTTISALTDFSKKYEKLYSVNKEFEENYNEFKKAYLAYGSNLNSFSDERQAYYVSLLKKELEKIRDVNLEANKSLATYESDINRLMEILLENFSNSLKLKIADSYGLVFSDTDITSITAKYDTAKSRYYDADGNILASKVLANTGATQEIEYIYDKLSEINTKVVTLIGTGANSNTFENVKIRLENEMVKYYNANYEGYRQDLLLKLKEKLNIVSLEAKNVILAADTIDLRYSLLNDKITKSNDANYINEQVAAYKKEVAIYSYLNSDIINKKLSTLDNNLSIFAVKKELGQFKYNKMSQTKYDASLVAIFNKLKTKYPEKHTQKLNTVLTKVNSLLENGKLSDKNRFMLLCVKLNILNYLK